MDIPRRGLLGSILTSIIPLEVDGDEGEQSPGFGEGFGECFGGPVEEPECFIATASAGYKSKDVQQLRRFRDTTLKNYRLGRAFTTLYYRISPPIARWISKSDRRQRIVRTIVTKPAAAVTRLL